MSGSTYIPNDSILTGDRAFYAIRSMCLKFFFDYPQHTICLIDLFLNMFIKT